MLGLLLCTAWNGSLLRAQSTVSITCDSLFKMPFLAFNPDKLPEGFLDCLGGYEADVPMMKKWALLLSANQGDQYTVGDMKRVLDSVDKAMQYRKTASLVEDCRAVYRQPFRLDAWPSDSLAMQRCGVGPRMLGALGNLARSGTIPAGASLSALVGAYEKNLPNLLQQEVEANGLHCGDAPVRPFSYGLHAYDDPAAAMACANNIEKPILLVFAAWMNNTTRRTEELTLRDLDLFTRLNRETLQLVLYADDPTPLPPDQRFPGAARDTLVSTRGALAVEWAYRYLQIKDPPGVVLLSPDGRTLYTVHGEPTRDDLYALLEEARKLAAAKASER